uniref:Uncharacterized protein n=1 Tax=Romanomermis culicivorax TaxID=13658 RepID=A0A915IHV4_ROMCU
MQIFTSCSCYSADWHTQSFKCVEGRIISHGENQTVCKNDFTRSSIPSIAEVDCIELKDKDILNPPSDLNLFYFDLIQESVPGTSGDCSPKIVCSTDPHDCFTPKIL